MRFLYLPRPSRWQPLRKSGVRLRGRRLFLSYCVAMVLTYILLLPQTAGPGFWPWGPGDFTIFYTAAHILRTGNAHRLYDLALQTKVQQRFLLPHGWVSSGGLLPYNYPPFFALVFLPLSSLSLANAFHIWNLVNLALLLASVWFLLPLQGEVSRKAFLITLLPVFSFFPVFEELIKGQSSFVVLLALTLTYVALKRRREYLAGIALALGLVKPQLVLIVVAMLLYHRRWRTILTFCATGAVLLLASLAVVGIEGMVSYVKLIQKMLEWDGIYGFSPSAMFNLRGTAYRLGQLVHVWPGVTLSPTARKGLTALLSAFVLALVVRTWRRKRPLASPEFDLQFGQSIVAGLLLTPHLYGHDLVLLILAGFLLLRYLTHHGRQTQGYRLVALGHVTTVVSLMLLGPAGQAQVVALMLIALLTVDLAVPP